MQGEYFDGFDSVLILNSSKTSVLPSELFSFFKAKKIFHVKASDPFDKYGVEIEKVETFIKVSTDYSDNDFSFIVESLSKYNSGRLLLIIVDPLFHSFVERVDARHKILFSVKDWEYELNTSAIFQKALKKFSSAGFNLSSTMEMAGLLSSRGFNFKNSSLSRFDDGHIVLTDQWHTDFFSPKNIKVDCIIVVDKYWMFHQAIRQFVENMTVFSNHHFAYVDIRDLNKVLSRNKDVVVIINYSVRVFAYYMDKKNINALSRHPGPKILFVQDEYEEMAKAREFIKRSRINTVFTCVPDESINKIYPEETYPHTRFVNYLTGYISNELIQLKEKTLSEGLAKNIDVFYRGRMLSPLYGTLGKEKWEIGKIFKERLPHYPKYSSDIDVMDESRLYGDQWYLRLRSSRFALGTESGSNVFDFNGDLDKKKYSNLSEDKYLAAIQEISLKYENHDIKMNQISPKIFEYMACGVIPILFEGGYSGVIKEEENYLSLKKDFSNFEQLLSKMNDVDLCSKIVKNNFDYISYNNPLHFKNFVQNKLDLEISSFFSNGKRFPGVYYSIEEFDYPDEYSLSMHASVKRKVEKIVFLVLRCFGINGKSIKKLLQTTRIYKLSCQTYDRYFLGK